MSVSETDSAADERTCHVCRRAIVVCDVCHGAREVDGAECEDCEGTGEGCPVHHAEWTHNGY
jgi:hypothetical protein